MEGAHIKTLGQRIRDLRERKELTGRELAAIICVSPSTLSQYETDTRVPSDDIKTKLADFFEVSIDYLLGRTESPAPIHAGETEKEEHKENPLDAPDISDYLFAFHGEIRDLDEDDQKTIADMIRFMQARKKEKQGEKENI